MDPERLLVWMEPWIDPAFDPPPYDERVMTDVLSTAAGYSAPFHARLLQRWNGTYALGGLLHLFGACEQPPNHSLRAWNAPDGWRAAWGRLTEGLTFFAEDAFGDQFAYRGGKIVRFRALLGGIQVMPATLPEWIESVLLDTEKLLPKRLFEECVRLHGPLPHGGHFAPTGPVAIDDPLQAEQFQVMPVRDSMEMKAVAASRVVRRTTSASLRVQKP